MYDEAVARKRYGDVFARAGMPLLAVHQYVLAGAKTDAVAAARDASESLDLSRYLTARFPAFVHASAAAVCVMQADLVPDDRVEATATALLAIIDSRAPRGIFSPDPVKHAIGALAALDNRLPIDAAQHLVPLILENLPTVPGRHTHIHDEMLAFLSTCVRLPDDDIAATAAKALLQCARLDIHKAPNHLFRMRAHREVVLDEIAELARSGDSLAIKTLAAWDFPVDGVVADVRAASTLLLEQEVGQPRTSWDLGVDLSELVILWHGALSGTQDASDPDLTAVLSRVVLHLVSQAEDHHDIAVNRSIALGALQGLESRVPEPVRREVCTRLIALHDNPQLNEQDLLDQQSVHPLSRFRVDFGSERLGAEALLTASIYADTAAQAQEIHGRLQPTLYSALPDKTDAKHRAETLLHVDRLAPVTLDSLATHPAGHVRQAAVMCWARSTDRNSDLARVFAADTNRGVRRLLASHLSLSSESSEGQFADVLDLLKNDPSALVRGAARGKGP